MKNFITKQDLLNANNNTIKGMLKGRHYKYVDLEFGLSCNKQSRAEKAAFLADNSDILTLRVHRFSVLAKNRKTGYKYNRLFAREYRFEQVAANGNIL